MKTSSGSWPSSPGRHPHMHTHVTQWPPCWTLIGCHHAKFASKLKYFNSSEFVAAQILVNVLACAQRKCGATNQNLSPVFSREKFARHASLRSLCMRSCRPVAFGVNAQIFPDWAKLAKIASTIPVSSVPAERAFSLQNRIKTSIRNRLAEEKVTRYDAHIEPWAGVERLQLFASSGALPCHEVAPKVACKNCNYQINYFLPVYHFCVECPSCFFCLG